MSDGPLTKDEIAALLAESSESINGKKPVRNINNTLIVLVQYGRGTSVTHTSVHLFDPTGWNTACEYCDKINGLVLAGSEWVRAKIVHENEINELSHPYHIDMLLDLDDRCIQKILGKIDKQTLATSLKHIDEEIILKIRKNMSKRAVKILEEDMAYMGPTRIASAMEAQKKILDVIWHLVDTGEIVIYWNKEEP